MELFFDLVYVFAITQLALFLAHHPDAVGVAKTVFMLLMFWWAWNSTTFAVNFFDPRTVPVRLTLIGVMLLSLTMAIAIPEAFGDRALLFAGSFVTLQVGRNILGVLGLRKGTEHRRANTLFLIWSLFSAPFWIAGAFVNNELRPWVWVVAIAIDYLGPAVLYYVPGRDRVRTEDWPVDGHHYTERFHLLIIIALGETIIVTGNLLARDGISETAQLISLLVSFLTTVCLWWLYFDVIAPGSQQVLSDLDDPAVAARNAFVYLHLPIVAGIIAMAVAFELTIAHPGDPLLGWELGIAIAGPVLYIAGHNAVRRIFDSTWSLQRWAAATAILLLWFVGENMTSLQAMSYILAVLLVLTVWEAISYRRWFRTVEDPVALAALEHLGR